MKQMDVAFRRFVFLRWNIEVADRDFNGSPDADFAAELSALYDWFLERCLMENISALGDVYFNNLLDFWSGASMGVEFRWPAIRGIPTTEVLRNITEVSTKRWIVTNLTIYFGGSLSHRAAMVVDTRSKKFAILDGTAVVKKVSRMKSDPEFDPNEYIPRLESALKARFAPLGYSLDESPFGEQMTLKRTPEAEFEEFEDWSAEEYGAVYTGVCIILVFALVDLYIYYGNYREMMGHIRRNVNRFEDTARYRYLRSVATRVLVKTVKQFHTGWFDGYLDQDENWKLKVSLKRTRETTKVLVSFDKLRLTESLTYFADQDVSQDRSWIRKAVVGHSPVSILYILGRQLIPLAYTETTGTDAEVFDALYASDWVQFSKKDINAAFVVFRYHQPPSS